MATAVINLLRLALHLGEKDIRCTSVDGYRLSAGAQTDETLKKELIDADVFIALLTPNAMDSMYVNFEMGARWGAEKSIFPLLAKGGDITSKRSPLQVRQALDGADFYQLSQFLEDCAAELQVNVASIGSYKEFLNAVIREASRVNDSSDESVDEPTLSEDQLSVLALFSSHLANKDREIQVSAIPNELAMHPAKVDMLLEEMVESGWLTYHPRIGKIVVQLTKKGFKLLGQLEIN